MSDSDARNQEATPLRLQQAREKGDIPQSRDLAVALSLLGILTVGGWLVIPVSEWLVGWTKELWQFSSARDNQPDEIIQLGQNVTISLCLSLAPVLLGFALIHVIGVWLQTGPVWLPSKAKPDAQRLGPAATLQNFSMWTWFTTSFANVPKTISIVGVMFAALWYHHENLMQLPGNSGEQLVVEMFRVVTQIALWVVAAMLMMGLVDYGIQWMAHRNRLRMTEQEMRDEIEQQEGDAVSRSRQRQLDRV